jgi:hypothetical protein
MLKRIFVAILAFVLGFVTVSSATSAPKIDACSMLTQAQVSAALGVAVDAGRRIVPSAANLCGWAPPGGPAMAGKKLTLDFKTVQAFEVGKTSIKGITKTPVSGIGDDAYYVTAGGLGTNLSVRKGNVAFNIALHSGEAVDQIKAKEKDLALQIQKKL